MNDYPEYYSSLGPFKRLFRSGLPVLTYHKLGPRPSHVRIKGLYVSESFFRKQLRSLRQNQFTSLTLDDAARSPFPSGKGVVITFDDAYSNVLKYGVQPLRDEGFTAIQFVVADALGQTNYWDTLQGEAPEPLMDKVQIKEWLSAGQRIGSHTLSHPHLSQLSDAEAREEIYASKAKLEDLFSIPVEHFCYPYGDMSPSVVEHVRQAGYKTACTVSPGINLAETPLLALHRFTARYPSCNLKAWRQRLHSWWLSFKADRS